MMTGRARGKQWQTQRSQKAFFQLKLKTLACMQTCQATEDPEVLPF